MFYYWYQIIRTLIDRNFKSKIRVEDELIKVYRVRLLDCDGLRVMAAFKYAAYMDLIRWELIARSRLYNEMVLKGLAPTLGSQKIIYRKPLKRWTKFTLKLNTAGWDEKWVYHIHTFEQNGEIKAIGVTRALVWKRDKPQILSEILKNIGVRDLNKKAPDWILRLFESDSKIISKDFQSSD